MDTSMLHESNSRAQRFVDVLIDRFMDKFLGSEEDVSLTAVGPENMEISQRQRLLMELENARRERDFLEQTIAERDFDEESI